MRLQTLKDLFLATFLKRVSHCYLTDLAFAGKHEIVAIIEIPTIDTVNGPVRVLYWECTFC